MPIDDNNRMPQCRNSPAYNIGSKTKERQQQQTGKPGLLMLPSPY